MKLSPTEIFKGKKIFFIGGTGRRADTLVRMNAASAVKEPSAFERLSPEEPAMRTGVSELR